MASTQHTLSAYSYGKDDVRILRIVRDANDAASHRIVEYRVRCLLSGSSLAPSYTKADNSVVVATDSIKNTLNLLAKRTPGPQILVPETFAMVIVEHFLRTYSHIDGVHVDIDLLKWSRIQLSTPNGARSSGFASTVVADAKSSSHEHPHSFIRDGNEKRYVRAYGKRSADGMPELTELECGLRDLVVLKSSGSAFYGFWRDEFTTLPEVQDRIFSTSVDCRYVIALPAKPLGDLLTSTSASMLPPFDAVAQAAVSHVLTTFATHSSPSVQATMYQTGLALLNDASAQAVQSVDLTMPNRHYIPIDLSWAGEENINADQAEVFLPSEHPSGLIKATVTRGANKV